MSDPTDGRGISWLELIVCFQDVEDILKPPDFIIRIGLKQFTVFVLTLFLPS